MRVTAIWLSVCVLLSHRRRKELMPAERAFSITEIVDILRNYDFSKQRRLSFEYIVFKDVNDSLVYAKRNC
mgnify:CR=1 FL=1